MTDAPFVIRPPSAAPLHPPQDIKGANKANQRAKALGPSFGTVLKDGKVEGTLYWNHESISSTLVCGASNKEVLRTVMQTLRLHLNESRNSSALIFHANTRDYILPPSQVTTVQIAKRLSSPTVFLGPRPSRPLKSRYTDIPLSENSVLPLRIAERDISLAHVLALCTPPLEYPGREGILAKVHSLIGTLDTFSIQDFNRLVDGETWDEHGSAFMVVRQTLLTTLTLADEEGSDIGLNEPDSADIASRIKAGGPIIVDLSNPVLRSTGMDAILFDMILCLYCVINKDSKKLLVLDQPSSYLTPTSPLLSTLITLSSMHSDSPLRTLYSTTDLTELSPRLLNHLDTFICHEIRSPDWLAYLQHRVACAIEEKVIYNLESRQAVIISPRSVKQTQEQVDAEEGHHHHRVQGHVIGTKWGTHAQKVEIGWEWPLSVEQQKIEQLQALVAQLSQNAVHTSATAPTATAAPPAPAMSASVRRSRKESTYVEATMSALRGALGYLASRKAADMSSTEVSPNIPANAPAATTADTETPHTRLGTMHSRTETGTGTMVTDLDGREKDWEEREKEPVIIEEKESSGEEKKDSSGKESEWMKRTVTPDPTLKLPPKVDMRDFGPFAVPEKPLSSISISPKQFKFPIFPSPPNSAPPYESPAKYDKAKLTRAIMEAIKTAGGELGIPISSTQVGDAFRRTAPADVFRVPFPGPQQAVEVYRMLEPTAQARDGWRMSIPAMPGAWRMSMPPVDSYQPSNQWTGFGRMAIQDGGFSTWKEITEYAEKEGIVKIVSNGKEEWLVMPKPAGATLKLGENMEGMMPVQQEDGWYERREIPTAPQEDKKMDNSLYEPLLQTMHGLREKQTIVQTPFVLHTVSYELKRRFPTAIRDAGYKTVLEYIHGAQARGLVQISDDSSGSIYVQPADAPIVEMSEVPKPPVSVVSSSTNKSQPDSSAVPSSEVHVHYPRDRFEPLLAVLRSMKKHNLYQVTLLPISLAIEKMFPSAMARFGVTNMETYVTQARDAGLVVTGNTPNGNLWVSLPDNIDTHGSVTPTQDKVSRAGSIITASDPILSPPRPRPADFSRLLRAIRALAPSGYERVLCSRVGMMLNKEDYKAMNVETFSQALIAASKANLIVHGGVGGSAWVAAKPPDVAGVSSAKHRLEEPRSRLVKTSPPEIATNPVVPSGSAYKLPLSEADVEPFRPLLAILRSFIHGKHIAEPFRTVVEKNLLKARPDILMDANCNTMDDYILRAQSYGLIAQVGNGKASRLRLLENSGLSIM